MNTLMKMSQLRKLNQTSGNNTGGGSGQQTTQQATPAAGTSTQAGGSGTQAAGANQQQAPKEGLGYDEAEKVNVGGYSAEGLQVNEPKAHEKIQLGYEIEGLEEMSDEDILEVKQFAAVNKLSKPTAKAFADLKKSESKKIQQVLTQQQVNYQKKANAYKAAEVEKLKAELGVGGDVVFKSNLKKIGDFLGQHLPELKKEVDEGKAFLSASVMKDIFKMQEKLLKEDTLVTGSQRSQADSGQPSWMNRYKK